MYHSVKYENKGMKFWQYYEIGDGKLIPYSNLSFVSGLNVTQSFDNDNNEITVRKKKNQKTRAD